MNGIERRDAGLVLLLGVVSCGLYFFYWYYKMYEELSELSGTTPTGNSYGLDLLLTIVTCTLYGIWVDYKISLQLSEIASARGVKTQDTSQVVMLLDLAAFVTGFMTNYISSSVHQDQLNKLVRELGAGRQEDRPVTF